MSPDPKNEKLTVITTHVNADFDAVASMLAAQKLYPNAVVVFPGSHEKNLRNFFVQSMVYLFNMADIRSIDFSAVGRLVLVDTKQSSRIGKFATLMDRDDLEIHIYDHHPKLPDDIQGSHEVFEATGATVSILTEIIRKKKIAITPDEATIMCLGIYEDTGSFTFSSTTEKDFQAAAFLVSKGAKLEVISSLITREITAEQLSVLNELFQGHTKYNIKGIEVVVTSITMDRYVTDFAFLVHKMMKMENFGAIIAIASMVSKIYVVARSRVSEVDVGAIARELGGGGHWYAASATLKGKTLAETEQRVIELLYQTIKSGKLAKDIMSSPPIKVNVNVSCQEARNLLTRYNVNALVVTDTTDGREVLAGYITRQVIAKAIYLNLGQAPVKDYMTSEIETVGLDAELSEIQEKIIDNKQRILPVVNGHQILGVITRTDLLDMLVQQTRYTGKQMRDPAKDEIHARTRHVLRFMRERLPERLINILKTSGEVASELGYGAYVVGGFVRDLFLYRPNEDIDIVIEGEGITFAKKFASILGVRIHTHEKFGTAVIIFPDGFKIDVATARLEYYRFPADLPTIEMSSIKLDLFRRDFTINTLAIQLNPERFGILIDFFSAQKDIKEKAIRILHNLSFVEDPTRVFRAIRFEQRFGFTIGKLTSALIKNVVKMDFFQQLSGRRVFTELRLILEEENPIRSIERLNDYQLLCIIHPKLRLDPKMIREFDDAKKVLAWHDLLYLNEDYHKWVVYFLVLTHGLDKTSVVEICDKFDLSPKYRILFCQDRYEAEKCLSMIRGKAPFKPSQMYRELSRFKTEMILYMMAITRHTRVRKAISHYFTQLRHVTPSITGKDLKQMGLKPGPVYKTTLEAVLDAKLDGSLKNRNDELNFARNFITQFITR